MARSFMYSHTIDYWVNSLSDFAKVDYTGGRFLMIAASADGLTIAAKVDYFIHIYKLECIESIESNCNGSDYFFNFTIIPDQFPEDITWSLMNNKGKWVMGGKLPKKLLKSHNDLNIQTALIKKIRPMHFLF